MAIINTAAAIVYGALGGGFVEAVDFYNHISSWQAARHRALQDGIRKLPSLRSFVDPFSDTAAALTRLLLGAGAGGAFHTQFTGVTAAIAVGCSAPALLRQLGSTDVMRNAVIGTVEPAED